LDNRRWLVLNIFMFFSILRRSGVIMALLSVLIAIPALARVGALTTLSDLLDSEVIVYAERSDVEIIPGGATTFLRIQKASTIRGGGLSGELSLENQDSLLPPTAKSFLIFLSVYDGKFKLKNRTQSIIPFGGRIALPSNTLHSRNEIVKSLCKAFVSESNVDCALVQSYMLASLPEEELRANKEILLGRRAESDDLMDLATVNLAVRTGNLEKLSSVGNLQSDIRITPDGRREVNAFAEHVRGSLIGWFYRNASKSNYGLFVDFLSKQSVPLSSDILVAISPYATIDHLPKVVGIFEKSKDLDLIYGCMKNFNAVFEIKNSIPTIDGFRDNPEKFIQMWQEILKREGVEFPIDLPKRQSEPGGKTEPRQGDF